MASNNGIALRCKKRRSLEPRPHPSHILNKRYWDEIRAGRRPQKSQNSLSSNHSKNNSISEIPNSKKLLGSYDSGSSLLLQPKDNSEFSIGPNNIKRKEIFALSAPLITNINLPVLMSQRGPSFGSIQNTFGHHLASPMQPSIRNFPFFHTPQNVSFPLQIFEPIFENKSHFVPLSYAINQKPNTSEEWRRIAEEATAQFSNAMSRNPSIPDTSPILNGLSENRKRSYRQICSNAFAVSKQQNNKLNPNSSYSSSDAEIDQLADALIRPRTKLINSKINNIKFKRLSILPFPVPILVPIPLSADFIYNNYLKSKTSI